MTNITAHPIRLDAVLVIMSVSIFRIAVILYIDSHSQRLKAILPNSSYTGARIKPFVYIDVTYLIYNEKNIFSKGSSAKETQSGITIKL